MKTNNIFIFVLLLLSVAIFSCNKSLTSGGTGTVAQGGSMARFTITNNRLYIVNNTNLKIYDVSNAKTPSYKTEYVVGEQIETIYPYKNSLFMGSNSGMYAYDISNPDVPSNKTFVDHITSCDPVVANDSNVYLTLRGGSNCGGIKNEMQVYTYNGSLDKINFFKSLPLTKPYGLGFIGANKLGVCDEKNGLKIFDITIGTNPILKQTFASSDTTLFYDMIAYDSKIVCHTSKGLSYFDATDINAIVHKSDLK